MRYKAPLFGVLAVVLLAVAFWFLLYAPKNEELVAIRSDIEQLQSQQTNLNNEIRKLEELQRDEMQILGEMARLEEFIPAGSAQPAVIRQLQETADAAGVKITAATFGSPELVEGAPATGDPNTALASLGVTMVINGGYFQVVDFLRRLEVDVPRALLVQSVNMTEGEDNFPNIATTWGGRLFAVLPVAEGAAPAPSPDDDATPDAGADEDGELAPSDDDAPAVEEAL